MQLPYLCFFSPCATLHAGVPFGPICVPSFGFWKHAKIPSICLWKQMKFLLTDTDMELMVTNFGNSCLIFGNL